MKRQKKRSGIGRLFKGLFLAFFLAAAAFVLFFAVTLLDLDAWDKFDAKKILDVDQTLVVYDAQGNEYTRLHGLEDRVWVPLGDVPDIVVKAFVSAEDMRFYEHFGVDIIRIFGAAWQDIKAGSFVQGASTISQQLIKLSHLTSEKTISRKLEEAVLAYQMEQSYTKDQIMEMYLNYIYFGGGYYGIEAASLGYFGVHASELSTAEGAMLAGVLKSTARYAPHLNYDASVERRNHVLGLMYEQGYLSEEERVSAQAEKAVIVRSVGDTAKRGYYVDQALSDAAKLLNVDFDMLLTGGYRVYTALDPELQSYCEAMFTDDAMFPTADCEGALVVQQANTGRVIALVGGRESGASMAFNRAVSIRRQPGSVIKPVIVYAPALEEHGFTAASMLLDEPTDFNGYTPSNFGDKYYGWVTLREAVKRSLNVPAVKVLYEIGVQSGKRVAEACGIRFVEEDTSLTLALGGFTYGVSPWQIAGAYACFASGGVFNSPTLVTKITDAKGKVLYEYRPEQKRILSEQNNFILTSMLQSAISEGTGRRLGELNIPLAGKTGTVGEGGGNRDAWMAAYNPEYAAAVWMGYDSSEDGKALPSAATGGTYPALLLRGLFSKLYENSDAPDFTMPPGIVECKLDLHALGEAHEVLLATALTPQKSTVTEIFVEGTEPTKQSDYWVVPYPVANFNVTLNADGYPSISFTPRQAFVEYRLYREEGGTSVLVNKWKGKGSVSYVDRGVAAGTSCLYYVVPVHPELRVNSQEVTGPASSKIGVIIPKRSAPTSSPEDGDDQGLTIDALPP
ncbi:MAG: PBP1A family penicillin-binding protein [Eubacteriales bacterium]|nr:PBP1A family penicillin-binding protein [Eubacteriales bacterium]